MIKHETHSETDAVLLSLIKRGNSEAFGSIYDRYWKKLYAKVHAMLRNQEACEDILQDVFESLWVKRETLEIGDLKAYLFGCVRFQAFSHIAKNKESVRIDFWSELDAWFADHSTTNVILEKELQTAINTAIHDLPEKCREVYVLKRNESKSLHEISELLGISKKTAQNHITLALRKLKLSLREFLTLLF